MQDVHMIVLKLNDCATESLLLGYCSGLYILVSAQPMQQLPAFPLADDVFTDNLCKRFKNLCRRHSSVRRGNHIWMLVYFVSRVCRFLHVAVPAWQ